MRYRVKKETKPRLQTFGKYKAVAVHYQTIESNQLMKETSQRTGFSEGTIKGVLMSVAEVVNSHLREGDRVRLPEWGMMKLEIESEKVDDPKTFRAKKHIRGVRLHFLPESYEGTRPSTTASPSSAISPLSDYFVLTINVYFMEQIERIKAMEQHLDKVSQAVMRLSAALDEYAEAQAALHELEAYYNSDEWKRDFADDEAGLIPKDLKRGVLSEDAVWNVLEDSHNVNSRMEEVLNPCDDRG